MYLVHLTVSNKTFVQLIVPDYLKFHYCFYNLCLFGTSHRNFKSYTAFINHPGPHVSYDGPQGPHPRLSQAVPPLLFR